MFNKRLVSISTLAIAVLLFSSVAVGPAFAAKNAGSGTRGHKGGGTSSGCSTCVLTVSPNPVPLNSTGITITGSGFGANQSVLLDVSGWIPAPTVTADGNGHFSLFYAHTYTGSGNSFVNAWVGGVIVATAPYSVCSTTTC